MAYFRSYSTKKWYCNLADTHIYVYIIHNRASRQTPVKSCFLYDWFNHPYYTVILFIFSHCKFTSIHNFNPLNLIFIKFCDPGCLRLIFSNFCELCQKRMKMCFLSNKLPSYHSFSLTHTYSLSLYLSI